MRVTVITPSNVSIFPEYIIPNIRFLVQDTEVSVRATYAQCISSLADTALRYLEMGNSLQTHGVAPGVKNDKQEYDEVHFEVRRVHTRTNHLLTVSRYLMMLPCTTCTYPFKNSLPHSSWTPRPS